MEPSDVTLLTDPPGAGGTPHGTPLSALLWPHPDDDWAGRPGVERLFGLGRWLRALHDTAPAGDPAGGPADDPGAGADSGAAGGPPAELAELDRLLDDRLAGAGGDPLDRLHWTSLRQWARRLAGTVGTVHGRLGLETVLVDGDAFVVLAPGGLRTAHPALDVGGMYGDLVELTHRARLAGRDPAAYERLLTAFLTGYRGLLGSGPGRSGRDAPTELDTYRAAALRVASRAVAGGDPTTTGVDLELARRLVEHCWTLADAS